MRSRLSARLMKSRYSVSAPMMASFFADSCVADAPLAEPLEFLHVVGRQAGEDDHAGPAEDQVERRAADEDEHDAGDEQADQRAEEDRAQAREVALGDVAEQRHAAEDAGRAAERGDDRAGRVDGQQQRERHADQPGVQAEEDRRGPGGDAVDRRRKEDHRAQLRGDHDEVGERVLLEVLDDAVGRAEVDRDPGGDREAEQHPGEDLAQIVVLGDGLAAGERPDSSRHAIDATGSPGSARAPTE